MPLRLSDRAPRSASDRFDGTQALCALALGSPRRMCRPQQKRFAFRLRRAHPQAVLEGSSFRYTAIVVIGLVRADEDTVGIALDGYFSESDEPDVTAPLEAPRPDGLFVVISSPKKELFLERWAERMGVPVCHGVGGAFDVPAGVIRRAPPGRQRLGLEWLYRVVQEPRRMWRHYLVTNTVFCAMLTRDLLRNRGRRSAARRRPRQRSSGGPSRRV